MSKVLELLTQRRNELLAIEASKANWHEIASWHTRARPLIAQYFGQQLEYFDELGNPHWKVYPRSYAGDRDLTPNAGRDELAANNRLATEAKAQLLAHLDALIELMALEEEATAPTLEPAALRGSDVFIVHGHNERWVQESARFVEQLGATAVILREKPNRGHTIIEKFEEEAAGIGFAIVLLTGDDMGGAVDVPTEEQLRRARQNVVLELGFFLGTLGRAHVCALYEDGVEIPSDYNGVLFVPLDSTGGWRLLLAREMKAAGLPVDLNKAV